MKPPAGTPIAEPPTGRVVINIDWPDGQGYAVAGIRIVGGSQSELVPPEILMLLARIIDSEMAAQANAYRSKQGPQILLPDFRG